MAEGRRVMEAGIQTLVVYLIGAAVVGLVGFVIALWKAHHALELKVGRNETKQEGFEELREDVRALRDLVYRIAVKMDVPVFSEEYRR